jgi:hypothetical protein
MEMIRTTLIAATIGLVLGCDRTTEAERARAAEAQAEANKAITEAQNEATRKLAEAEREVADLKRQLADKANERSAEAQAKANETIRDVNEELARERNELREWGQKKMNEMDNRIDGTKAKAQGASADVRDRFDKALEVVDQKRKEVEGELATVNTLAAADLTRFRAKLEKEFADFQTSVRRLETTL